MDWSVGRGRRRPPRRPLLLSLAGHALIVTVLLVSPRFQPEPLAFESFQVVLVSPPAEMDEPAEIPAAPDLVVETPDPQPQPEEPPPPPPPVEEPAPEEPEPEPEPDPEPPKPEPPPTTPPEERPPAATETSETPTAEAGADIHVRMEGLRRDFPEYYADIIHQIDVCFRPPRGNLRFRAVVYFEIHADGTVSGRRLVERSGNAPFDYAALGAIECAGNGRFGPLPEELPYERLPVQFTFEPKGQ